MFWFLRYVSMQFAVTSVSIYNFFRAVELHHGYCLSLSNQFALTMTCCENGCFCKVGFKFSDAITKQLIVLKNEVQ
jgi:hypothetical protein